MTQDANKKYGVIIADPPWLYQDGRDRNGAATRHYMTTPTEDLAFIPVSDLAAADSVLLLWATWPKLKDAMDLVEAWGFVQITGFPWVKVTGEPTPNLFGPPQLKARWGTGYWVRACSEVILICKRGSPRLPSDNFLGLISDRFEHSRKPDNLHEYAESLDGPYLELFARRARRGWDLWGNEAPSAIEISIPSPVAA